MKKYLITAGAALALFLTWTGVSTAGDRIIYYSRSPVVVHSQRPVVVHGRPHAKPAWNNRHHYDRHDRYQHRYAGKDVYHDRRGHSSPSTHGSWYQPGFSLSLGIW